MWKKLTVRDAEKIARKIAFDKVRKKEYIQDPEISEIEGKLQETLGTRVHIERKENGGYITIDFFTNDDLRTILGLIKSKEEGGNPNLMLENFISQKESEINREDLKENQEVLNSQIQPPKNDIGDLENIEDSIKLMEDRTNEEIKKAEEDIDLYNIKNFSI
ncbi:TPA: hypothetical protein DCX66_02100 [Candidatus Nomurabacteria bacterium]|nr:hypothetical protein [Candidatus Nomurabacteria bacterium]